MIDHVRNSSALMVVRPTHDSAINRDLVKNNPPVPTEATPVTFLGKRESEHSGFYEKGALVDIYA